MKIKINYIKFFQIIFTSLSIFSIVSMGVFSYIYFLKPDIFDTTIENTIKSITPIINPVAVPEQPINVLLMGIDKVSENTDVMLVAHIDPPKKKVSVISIPRDTRVYYKSGTPFKLNAAYKQNMTKDKLAEILGTTIDYQIAADIKGFRNIVDILGGVTVDVPRNMNYDDYEQNLHIHLQKGVQLLDGNKSEQFVRFRDDYREGDLDRIKAQQIFFKAFVEQKLTPRYVFKIDDIVREILSNVESEMSYADIMKYALFAKNLKSEDIEFHTLPGESRYISDISYFLYDEKKTGQMMLDILY